MLSHSPGLHCGLNPVTCLSPTLHWLRCLSGAVSGSPTPSHLQTLVLVHISLQSTALSCVCVSLEQRGGMSCCPWYTVSLPCAGHAAVLHCETPHGNRHHHPAGIREVPRWRLQVRLLGGAGGGEWERMDPCSITSVSCQAPQEAAPWIVRAL